MGELFRFSTDLVPARERLEWWNAGAAAIGGIHARTLGQAPFNADVTRRSLGSVMVFRMTTGPHRAERTSELISQAPDSHIRLTFQERGRCTYELGERRTVLEPDRWILLDTSRPFACENDESGTRLALQIPRQMLSPSEQQAATSLADGVGRQGQLSRLLVQAMRFALDDWEDPAEAAGAEFGLSLIHLFQSLMIEQTWTGDGSSLQATMRDRICQFIRLNLDDPDLSVERIAKAMNCSRRYVHKVFNNGQTVTQFIWNQRLERCRADLTAARSKLSLTEIAFNHGFSSSAHFSRAFRARYGCSPSAYRSEGREKPRARHTGSVLEGAA